jgi:arylsulfatase A-like enzyme
LQGSFYFQPSENRAPEVQEPNLLFVLVDQWRRSAMGFMNDDPVETPNMDAFADDVAVFNHAVATVPVCTPDRAVLMTGELSNAKWGAG